MKADWKILLCLMGIMLASNCVWVLHSKEKIDRPPLDLTPLPESLLVLPDSGSGKYDTILLYRTTMQSSLDPTKADQRYYTYTIGLSGVVIIAFSYGKEHKSFELGYLSRSDIQELILDLNEVGFFRINEERIPYEYLEVKSTYFMGLLIGQNKRIQQLAPRYMIQSIHIRLKNFEFKTDYYGLDDASEYGDTKGLQILKTGIDRIEIFLKGKISEFDKP